MHGCILVERSSANKIPETAELREEDAVGVAAFLMECSCLAMHRFVCQNANCSTAVQCTPCNVGRLPSPVQHVCLCVWDVRERVSVSV